MHNELITEEMFQVLDEMVKSRAMRISIVSQSFYWFFLMYMSDAIRYSFAPFQLELLRIAENTDIEFITCVAFRNSAKSTILNEALTLWSILGKPQSKFVLIFARTQEQAKSYMKNIRRHLETNPVLRSDLGPFVEETDEWNRTSIVIKKYDAKITIASVDQSVRGIRHGSHRPDLVILDDIEDLDAVQTHEARKKLFRWFTGEVLPIGDTHTRIVLISNLLHQEAIAMQFKQKILEGYPGVYLEYPLVDSEGNSMWPGKYPDKASIEKAKIKFADDRAFSREMLLQIIPDEDQVIKPGWIQYYDEIPEVLRGQYEYIATGIDPAASQNTKSDYTAMVSAKLIGTKEKWTMYILPHPLNIKIDPADIPDTAIRLSNSLDNGRPTLIYVEIVGFQVMLASLLKNKGYPVEEYSPAGADKRSRLASISYLIKNGLVKFPRTGCEDLIRQLVGFGAEKNDDLSDAAVIVISSLHKKHVYSPCPGIITKTTGRDIRKRLNFSDEEEIDWNN